MSHHRKEVRNLTLRLSLLLGLVVGTWLGSWRVVAIFVVLVALTTLWDMWQVRQTENGLRCPTIEDPTYMMVEGKAQGYYPYTCPWHNFSTLEYSEALNHFVDNL